MALFDDHQIRENLLKDLDQAIKIKKERGLQLANKEFEYRIELTKAMAEGMISGIEKLGIIKPVAAIAVYDLCRGIPHVAKLRAERDSYKVLSESAQEYIYALKTKIRIIDSDIQNTINRGVS